MVLSFHCGQSGARRLQFQKVVSMDMTPKPPKAEGAPCRAGFFSCAGALVAAGLALLSTAPSLVACNVPVYRYALERWDPSPYDVCAVIDGEPTPEQAAELEILSKAFKVSNSAMGRGGGAAYGTTFPGEPGTGAEPTGGATPGPSVNVIFHKRIGDGAFVPPPIEEFLRTNPVKAPVLVILPHASDRPKMEAAGRVPSVPWMKQGMPKSDRKAVVEPFAPGVAAWLLDSPLRKTLVEHLMKGAVAVWLVIEGNSAGENDAFEESLKLHISEAGDALKTPGGDGKSAMPPGVLSPVLRLSRDATGERFLVSQLKSLFPAVRNAPPGSPVVVPVFGRGRALEALPANEITSELVGQILTFLVGNCSCEIKGMNPGIDLLLTAPWDKVAGASPRQSALPPLPGAGALAKSGKESMTTPRIPAYLAHKGGAVAAKSQSAPAAELTIPVSAAKSESAASAEAVAAPAPTAMEPAPVFLPSIGSIAVAASLAALVLLAAVTVFVMRRRA